MKLLSAYQTDVALVLVVETSPAIPSGLRQTAVPAVTQTFTWGLDVPLAAARRETRLLLEQAGALPSAPRHITALEGRDL